MVYKPFMSLLILVVTLLYFAILQFKKTPCIQYAVTTIKVNLSEDMYDTSFIS